MPAYSGKAQPFLDAIAASMFSSSDVRNWILAGTAAAATYDGASILDDEQKTVRWRRGRTKQPFWANYFCGKDSQCTCRIHESKSLESDAIFFLRSNVGRILAIHVEFKHYREPFRNGQPEGYPLRAACFAKTYAQRPFLNPHDDWMTVLFCGNDALADPRISHFQRVITHDEARRRIRDYPG
ncbi:hypothetical protein [Azospirillum sp. ST 5-10]